MSAALGPDHKRLSRIWRGMIDRCENPTTDSYPRYGGRGITVCDEWRDLGTFKAWAQAHGYAAHLTIDRDNNDGHYEPSNCRWATVQEQNQNRSGVHRAADGTAWCEIARRNGISQKAFGTRLSRGLTPEEAATAPPIFQPISAEAAGYCDEALLCLGHVISLVRAADPRSAKTLAAIASQVRGWKDKRTPTLSDDGKVYLRQAQEAQS